jgi:hypothetical protein
VVFCFFSKSLCGAKNKESECLIRKRPPGPKPQAGTCPARRCPRRPSSTGVAKRRQTRRQCPGRARGRVRKLRKLDQKLYGTDIDSASPPGPLLRRFRALGEVHPIFFGAYGEVSEGMEVLIGKLADAWGTTDRWSVSPGQRTRREGIARSILREEIGAACFNAHAHILLGRTKFCQPGYTARRTSSSAGTRGTGHREALGIWWHAPSPVELLVGLAG